VVNLAGILADVPDANAKTVDHLPPDVIAKLALDIRWMKATFPSADAFISLH